MNFDSTGKFVISDRICGREVYCAVLELFDTIYREGKWIIFPVDVMKDCAKGKKKSSAMVTLSWCGHN